MISWTPLAVSGLALAAALAVAPAAPAHASPLHPVGTWGASADKVSGDAGAAGLADRSVRNLVHTSLGGSGVRITLSNAFGDRPVTFTSAHVGVAGEGAAILPGTNRPVTFAGSPEVTLAPGTEVLSDPVATSVPADTTLAVSLHVVGESGAITGHNLAMQTSYLSGTPGTDVAADESGAAFTTQISSWYWVESVVVEKPRRVKTAVLFGDSITDGNGSTVGANRRWPDALADRVASSRFAGRYAVMNEGISANRVLADSSGGQRGLDRFRRDVLDQPGVSTVVLLAGINDIRWDHADEASDLIVAYRDLIAQAHAEDVCIVGATLTPYEGGSRYSPEREQVRAAVNEWFRTSGEFDGVVDFDAATRDPARPTRFLPAYDSGDHLHPGDAGYAAMAEAFDLGLLGCDR
ncbi:lysophospholipase L1-like esterase [Nocardioides luteus]|uniref:SGNH hydrolase n=1 Tax=Nocardioides luteus TaxID=1844 RepID=A0ABQ5T053_9ACTN|nr:SGNH/GDSL hydrolase family protein [Nocardioides luteus]MDR7310403.1 lysophospholipase L1-like esterase [Nocardioides luteus]GGR52976.1 SGNH hydrolase [Nocardioides luteus]GLJ69817.1 SGNH hydrolase [Nocardioides luteus]